MEFLRAIEPFLIFKKEQAVVAIRWQLHRLTIPTVRGVNGRICAKAIDHEQDLKVALHLKALKHV